MWLAEHLNFAGDIRVLMRRIPYIQYLAWMERRKRLWNEPSRADHYVMSLTNAVYAIFGAGAKNLDPYKIAFDLVGGKGNVDPTIKSSDYIKMRQQEAQARAKNPGKPGPRPEGRERRPVSGD